MKWFFVLLKLRTKKTTLKLVMSSVLQKLREMRIILKLNCFSCPWIIKDKENNFQVGNNVCSQTYKRHIEQIRRSKYLRTIWVWILDYIMFIFFLFVLTLNFSEFQKFIYFNNKIIKHFRNYSILFYNIIIRYTRKWWKILMTCDKLTFKIDLNY